MTEVRKYIYYVPTLFLFLIYFNSNMLKVNNLKKNTPKILSKKTIVG